MVRAAAATAVAAAIFGIASSKTVASVQIGGEFRLQNTTTVNSGESTAQSSLVIEDTDESPPIFNETNPSHHKTCSISNLKQECLSNDTDNQCEACAQNMLLCSPTTSKGLCGALTEISTSLCLASITKFCPANTLTETCLECAQELISCQNVSTVACEALEICINSLTIAGGECAEFADANCVYNLTEPSFTKDYCTTEKDDEAKWSRQLLCLLVITSCLIVITIFFEACKNGLREYVRIEYLPIVDHMYGELTVLGFVGLVLFVLESGHVLTTVSTRLFTEPEESGGVETQSFCVGEEIEAETQVTELIEMVHMSLFLVMVGLIVQIVSLLRISDFISRRWKRYEKQVGTDTQLIADLANLELAREDSWWVWLNPFVYADVVDLHRLKLYLALRNGFVHPPQETVAEWEKKAKWFKNSDKKAIADVMMTIHTQDPVGSLPAHRQRFKVSMPNIEEFPLDYPTPQTDKLDIVVISPLGAEAKLDMVDPGEDRDPLPGEFKLVVREHNGETDVQLGQSLEVGSSVNITYRLGHLPVDFDFHAYLHESMTLGLIHCLEIDSGTWISLWIIFAFYWSITWAAPERTDYCFYAMLGGIYLIIGLLIALGLHLHHVCEMLCPRHLHNQHSEYRERAKSVVFTSCPRRSTATPNRPWSVNSDPLYEDDYPETDRLLSPTDRRSVVSKRRTTTTLSRYSINVTDLRASLALDAGQDLSQVRSDRRRIDARSGVVHPNYLHAEKYDSPRYHNHEHPSTEIGAVSKFLFGSPRDRHVNLVIGKANHHIYVEGFLKVTLVTLGIYVAVWVRAFLTQPIHHKAPFEYLSNSTSIVLTIVAALPIPLIVLCTANVIRSYAMACHVELLKNPKVIHRVVELQQTRKIVELMLMSARIGRKHARLIKARQKMTRLSMSSEEDGKRPRSSGFTCAALDEAERVATKIRGFVEKLKERQKLRLTSRDVCRFLEIAEILPSDDAPRRAQTSELQGFAEIDEGAFADSPVSPTKPNRRQCERKSTRRSMTNSQRRIVEKAMKGCESGITKNAKGEPEVLLSELEAWVTGQFETDETSHEEIISFLWHDLVTARNKSRADREGTGDRSRPTVNATAAEDKAARFDAIELHEAFSKYDENVTLEMMHDVINFVDKDGDGLLCREEFINLLMDAEVDTAHKAHEYRPKKQGYLRQILGCCFVFPSSSE